jgi:hypothetical protein
VAWPLLAEAQGVDALEHMTKNQVGVVVRVYVVLICSLQKKKAKFQLRAARNAALVAAGGVAAYVMLLCVVIGGVSCGCVWVLSSRLVCVR